MIGFCGAVDFEGRAAHFSELKRMCGLHGGGCAYINEELALLCDAPICSDKNTLHTEPFGGAYCAAVTVASCIPLGEELDGKRVAAGYIKEGIAYLERLSFPFSLAIYDAHHGELVLARGEDDMHELFYAQKDGVIYFSSALRPLIRLWGGCVRVSYDVLRSAILSQSTQYPEGLFLDISALKSSEMLICTCFERSVVQYKTDENICLTHEKNRLSDTRDMRHSLCELLFLSDYPKFDIGMLDGIKRRELRSLERQIDRIIEEHDGCYPVTDIKQYIDEKNIPLRIKQKGMLAESLMWLDTFNIVLK